MTALYGLLAFIIVQRLGELAYGRANTKRLVAQGAVEHGAGHYPLFILLHGGWLAAMALFIEPAQPVSLPLAAVYGVLQVARLWIIVSLKGRWTTRIIVPPHDPPVTTGPYRIMRHPNYAVVIAEIAVAPLIFGAWKIALIFSILNLALLKHRVTCENRALAQATEP